MSNDFTKVLTKDHEDKWVAFSPDYKKVVDFSADLIELRKRIGNKDAVYLKIPESGRSYVY